MSNVSVAFLVVGAEPMDEACLLGWAGQNGTRLILVPFEPACESSTAAASQGIIIDGRSEEILAIGECARLRAAAPKTPIAVLGESSDTTMYEALSRSGATRYFKSANDTNALLRVLQDAHSDIGVSEPTPALLKATEKSGLRVDPESRRAWYEDTELKLSAHKFELLAYLVANSGRAISAQELVARGLMRPAQRQRYKDLILELKNRLGSAREFIRAVPGYGYRFDCSE